MSEKNGVIHYPYTPGEIHPNLKFMSNSGNAILHGCAKRYQLDKLLNIETESTTDTIFGTSVGVGIGILIETSSRERAYFAAFLSWEGSIADEDEKAVKDKKLFWHVLNAIDAFYDPLNGIFSNMQLAVLDGKPALELGFTIDCGDGFYYRGFIDAVMVDHFKKVIVVLECKTTKFSKLHEAIYKHSSQALGYSLIIDMIVEGLGGELDSSYTVYYPVYKTSAMEWEVFDFVKTHTNRANWIKNILIDKRHIIEYSEDDHFPMRGEFCYNYFRPCPHFGICEMKVSSLCRNPVLKVDAPGKFQFEFKLADIIANQLDIYGEFIK